MDEENLRAEIKHLTDLVAEVSGRNVSLYLENLELKRKLKSYRAKGETMEQRSIMNGVDAAGNPCGGFFKGVGISIEWQNGPRKSEIGGELMEPNGAFVEDAIYAAKQRLEFFQAAFSGKFACRENALAITKLDEALHWLEHRTKAREARGVEGMNLP